VLVSTRFVKSAVEVGQSPPTACASTSTAGESTHSTASRRSRSRPASTPSPRSRWRTAARSSRLAPVGQQAAHQLGDVRAPRLRTGRSRLHRFLRDRGGPQTSRSTRCPRTTSRSAADRGHGTSGAPQLPPSTALVGAGQTSRCGHSLGIELKGLGAGSTGVRTRGPHETGMGDTLKGGSYRARQSR